MDAETVLRKLLAQAFYVGMDGVLFTFKEGAPLREVLGVEFERSLLPFLDETRAAQLAAQLSFEP